MLFRLKIVVDAKFQLNLQLFLLDAAPGSIFENAQNIFTAHGVFVVLFHHFLLKALNDPDIIFLDFVHITGNAQCHFLCFGWKLQLTELFVERISIAHYGFDFF